VEITKMKSTIIEREILLAGFSNKVQVAEKKKTDPEDR
jgi:hypothetical protein